MDFEFGESLLAVKRAHSPNEAEGYADDNAFV